MAEDDDEIITCIYCKKEGVGSREHVLARSLGGDATSRSITCTGCNTNRLSRIDQALAERSLVAISRTAHTAPTAFDVQLGGEHFHHDTERDIYVEVNLTNKLKPVPFPQIHHLPSKSEFTVLANERPEITAMVEFLDRQIEKATLRSLHVKVGPDAFCTNARFVMHRSKDGFARVPSVGAEAGFFDALEKAWQELRKQMLEQTFVAESTPTPTIAMNLSIRPDDVYRAVAKTAFNVLATDVSSDLALSREFDEIRDYILGKDIRHSPNRQPDEVAVDTRFVLSMPFGEAPLIPTDEHAITLFYDQGKLLAYVTLYKVHSFLVILGTISLPDEVFLTHEFSCVRRGNKALDVQEIYERMSRNKK